MDLYKVEDDYFIASVINQQFPSKGVMYYDYNHVMPLNRVLYLSNYFDHEGTVYVFLNYSVNGSNHQDHWTYFWQRVAEDKKQIKPTHARSWKK